MSRFRACLSNAAIGQRAPQDYIHKLANWTLFDWAISFQVNSSSIELKEKEVIILMLYLLIDQKSSYFPGNVEDFVINHKNNTHSCLHLWLKLYSCSAISGYYYHTQHIECIGSKYC